jgi:hypothetical protein
VGDGRCDRTATSWSAQQESAGSRRLSRLVRLEKPSSILLSKMPVSRMQVSRRAAHHTVAARL